VHRKNEGTRHFIQIELPSLTATTSRSQMTMCGPYFCTAVRFFSASTNGSQQSIPASPCVMSSNVDSIWQQDDKIQQLHLHNYHISHIFKCRVFSARQHICKACYLLRHAYFCVSWTFLFVNMTYKEKQHALLRFI